MSRIRKALRQAFLSLLLQFGMTMPIYTARLAWRFISGLTPTRAAPCRHSHHPMEKTSGLRGEEIDPSASDSFLLDLCYLRSRRLSCDSCRKGWTLCNAMYQVFQRRDRQGRHAISSDVAYRQPLSRVSFTDKMAKEDKAVDKLKKNCFVPCLKMPIVFTCIFNKLVSKLLFSKMPLLTNNRRRKKKTVGGIIAT